ncbi:hypothetical protein PACTADRAFT_49277 [Pachysolen tannophilus NRRL Y-2460]|uniref:Uncharacterized protein n=1 Tax=Pachysolen tannophilus NRRL Y-2460 TaxID=669874 RepID=A0A1E4TVP7_PACTA|nr:hypothetical protein PACTADRAFT_49277 [Pachysolen tannophilus NRRL Y-2460]
MISWLVAQVPQQITNYQNKTVDGISLSFLILWFLGDLTSLVGCILTNQLEFQIYLALYFLYNDFVLFGQWYYYSYVYPQGNHTHLQHKLSRGLHGHNNDLLNTNSRVIDGVEVFDENLEDDNNVKEDTSSYGQKNVDKNKVLIQAAILMANSSSVSAAIFPSSFSASDVSSKLYSKEFTGTVISWTCTVIYLSSRLPQLFKNYKRKSVDGVSPLLFLAASIGNLTYTLSILTNCTFIWGEEKNVYLLKELPYILGSSGTIIFDVFYFYQRWLYGSYQNLELTGIDEQTEMIDESTSLLV